MTNEAKYLVTWIARDGSMRWINSKICNQNQALYWHGHLHQAKWIVTIKKFNKNGQLRSVQWST